MPRHARVKDPTCIYHIMCRSISDTKLFKSNADKEEYLKIVKKYPEKFGFKVYAYCLMDTHCHFIIDSNGADISSIMQHINQYYAQKYFNVKHKRRGHLFADRFKSIIVEDDAYLLTLSAYIYRNPYVIKEYANCIEKYEYSSLGIYLGIRNDNYDLVDSYFILKMISDDLVKARALYLEYINSSKDNLIEDEIEFKNEKAEYRSERVIIARNFTPEKITEFISADFNNKPADIHIKHKRSCTDFKAVCVLLMQSFCGYTQRQICVCI